MFFFPLLPLGVTTVNHVLPSHPIPCIHLCHKNLLHVHLHYVHESSLWPYLFLLPGSSIFLFQYIHCPFSAHVKTMSQPCLSSVVSKLHSCINGCLCLRYDNWDRVTFSLLQPWKGNEMILSVYTGCCACRLFFCWLAMKWNRETFVRLYFCLMYKKIACPYMTTGCTSPPHQQRETLFSTPAPAA